LWATFTRADEPPIVERVEPPLPAVEAAPVPPTITEPPEVICDVKPDKPIGPLGPKWDSDEFILWWLKPQSIPTLLIGRPGQGVPLVNQLNTTVLVGGELKSQDHAGGRFMGGWAVDNDETIGIEFSYFFLGSRSLTQSYSSAGGAGDSTLARPYRSVVDGSPQSFPVAEVGVSSGRFEMVASSRVQGAEANAFTHLWAGGQFRLDGIVGFRFLQVNEGIRIAQRTNEVIGYSYGWLDEIVNIDSPSFPVGGFLTSTQVVDIVDQIDGHNIFYGVQIGLRADWSRGPVFVESIGKVALGQTNEVIKINGVQVVNVDGVPTSGPGGFYAQSTNSGRFTKSVFAVLPELTVRTGWQYKTSRWFVGYNFLYLSRLARPGDQIDEQLIPPSRTFGIAESRIATPHPILPFRQSDFWAQGLVIGAELRY